MSVLCCVVLLCSSAPVRFVYASYIPYNIPLISAALLSRSNRIKDPSVECRVKLDSIDSLVEKAYWKKNRRIESFFIESTTNSYAR